MILFYVWTDTQLINCVNTKCNFFEKDCADILIYKQDRMSEYLLEIIRKKGIFSNIYIIDADNFFDRDIKKINIINSFIMHIQFKKIFKNQLESMIKGKKYEILLVSAFWSETLNIFKCLKKYNKDIHIEMVEEGMANYSGSKNWIYRAAPTTKFKAMLRAIFYCRSMGILARRKVSCFYLYRPELSWTHQKVKARKLPVIDEKNAMCYQIFDEWQEKTDNLPYIDCKFIFIADAPKSKICSYDVLSHMLQFVPDTIKKRTVIKLHPIFGSQNGNDMSMNKEGIWIDKRKIPIENILFHCDINNKVLIVNHSSALLYLKCMLNKEPYLIFTYRMQPYCEKRLINRFDYFSEKIKEIFVDTDKIVMPNTIEEFQTIMGNFAEKFCF